MWKILQDFQIQARRDPKSLSTNFHLFSKDMEAMGEEIRFLTERIKRLEQQLCDLTPVKDLPQEVSANVLQSVLPKVTLSL
jgi:hypothetical protein